MKLRFESTEDILAVGVVGVLDQGRLIQALHETGLVAEFVVYDNGKGLYVTFFSGGTSGGMGELEAANEAIDHLREMLEEDGVCWVTWTED